MSIRTKTLLLLMVCSVVPLLIFGGTDLYYVRKQSIESASIHSLEVAHLLHDKIVEHLHSEFTPLQLWSRSERLVEAHDRGEIDSLIQEIAIDKPNLAYVAFLDAQGNVLGTNAEPLRAHRFFDESGFQEALGGKEALQDVELMEPVQDRVLQFFFPVYGTGEGHKLTGVLTAGLRWARVNEFISSASIHGQPQNVANHIMLLKRSGLVISCFDAEEMFTHNLIEDGVLTAPQAQDGASETVVGISEHGLKSYAAHIHFETPPGMPNPGWLLILLQDYDALMAPVSRLQNLLLMVLFGTVALIVVFVLLIAYKITHPILTISRAARAVGGGDLEQIVPVSSTDEIGTLAATFNKMVSRLRKVVHALEISRTSEQRANRAKSDFLAMMSHEIRTPMYSIVGLGNVLLEELADTCRDDMQTIVTSGNYLLSIINDILDFSKIEAGEVRLENADLDLEEVINDVLRLATFGARDKSIELTSFLDPNAQLRVRGDPGRLRQIVTNYVGNAVKFTNQGHIEVRVRLDEDRGRSQKIRVEVQDSGIGIPNDKLETLFEAFTQADMSISRKYGGTGLGLTINKRLATLMGGEVGVESEPGQGSTFWFTAVLDKQVTAEPVDGHGLEGPKAKSLQRSPTPTDLTTGLRVLVAEDNPINRKVSSRMLTKLGCDFDTVNDGQEAVEAAGRAHYDLVLMDMQMPNMDGLEATAEIRARETPGAHLPIVALTANAMPEDRQRCLDRGMDDFLSKPFGLDQLRAILERFSGPLSTTPRVGEITPAISHGEVGVDRSPS